MAGFLPRTDVSKQIEWISDRGGGFLPAPSRPSSVLVKEVGDFFAQIAAQEPGKVTGKIYYLLKGGRLVRGIGLMMYYRAAGKVKARM